MRLNPSLKLLRFALSLAVSGLLVTSSHAAHANEIGAGGQNVFSRGLEDQKILEIHNQFAKGDYSQKKLLFIGARKGNPRACNLVGWLFDNGVLLKKDSAKALQWFPSPPANPSDAKEKSNEEKQLAIRYAKAYSALKDAQDVYARELQKNDVAMRYLTDRGVSSESILKFGLGFAPNAWNTITGSGKLNAALIAALVDSGLATRKNDTSDHYYDRFRDRITFPIYG